MFGTGGLQSWIQNNIVPLLLFVTAVVLFLVANRGDNAKAMRIVGGVVIALAVLGLAVGNNATVVGSSLWGLVTGS
jgi:hypothetical protein